MLPAFEMDHSGLGTADDSIDPTIFSCIDLGNANASNSDMDFNWVDEFITSTQDCEPTESECTATSEDAPSATVSIQQAPDVQQQQQQQQQRQQQQQLLHNVLQQQQQQPPSVGNVIMAMGQSSQPQALAVVPSDSSTPSQPLLPSNQPTILQSSVGSQAMASSFILKASTPIQLVTPSVSQSTAAMGAPQQFVPAASGLTSITPSQSSSPLVSRSLTPNVAMTPITVSHPSTHTTSGLSGINLLQVQQSPQLAQTASARFCAPQLPLSNFVANQQNLQGHTVLTAQGSNIVHTQNALIQNPNVVNVNVAHVLSNQLPQVQVLQTTHGKFLVQSPASNQQLPQQLCLGQVAGAQPVQVAGSQAMQMTGQPVQLAGAQTMQVASNVGLAQPTVIAQPQSNVALGSNSGVGQQQASYNLINIGGSQGQILVQRMPSSATPVTHAQPLPQGPIFLRTVNGQQQLIQQPNLQSTPATTQVDTKPKPTIVLPQQLVAQAAGGTHNIPLQQLLTGMGGHSLHLVGQPTAVSTPQAATLNSNTTTTTGIVLQPLVTSNQAGSKSGTVTLNLAGQNLNLQNLSALQLNSGQQQPIIVQQQQQQFTVQQARVRAASPQVSVGSSSKKSRNKNTVTSSSASGSSSSSIPVMSADNILSAALMSSGILDDEELQSLINGNDMSDCSMAQPEVPITPSPSSVRTTPTPTPTPPPPTPPTTTAKKSKKKKKEPSGVVQHVVLSSTTGRAAAITITTASATVATTTVSQSVMLGQPLNTSTHTLIGAPLISLTTNSSSLSTMAPATASTTLATSTLSLPSTASSLPVRGKQGPPNVTVKGVGSLQGMSAADRQELTNIQANLTKLREQPGLDQNSLAVMQQLDMKRKKILAAHHTNSMALRKQQQQEQKPGQAVGAAPMKITLQGQQVTVHPPVEATGLAQGQQAEAAQPLLQPKAAQSTQSLQSSALSKVPSTQPQLVLQPACQPAVQGDVKSGVVSTPSTHVLHVQPKSSAKLTLVSPKPDSATASTPQTVTTGTVGDTKSVLGVGSVSTTSSNQEQAQGATYTAGNVIMAMSNPPSTGQGASTQPKMLRIQIGGHNTQAMTFTKAPATAITTSAQQVLVPSPHKIAMATSMVTTATTTVTSSVSQISAVGISPSQARPVQIKIANQLLTLQLTQQQQEKLELHLSRMTLDQQQAFLRQQHHVLAKLQHRVDSHSSTQKSAVATGGESQTASTAAAAVAPVCAAGDSAPPVQQAVQVMTAASTLATTPTQQLPVTVQALVGSPAKTESGSAAPGGTASTTSSMRCINLEIPTKAMIHSQLGRDQKCATNPDTKTPFTDHREACRRLLRYHVHQSHDPTPQQMQEFDQKYEIVSQDLVKQKENMMSKYRQLILMDSMRKYPTSEQVLISRMWSSEMQMLQREERELVKSNPDAFVPMPMSYLEKDLFKNEEEDSEKEEEEEASHPQSEEDEEYRREEESEEDVQQHADNLHQEDGISVKTEIDPCEQPSKDYFHSSPYHSYPTDDTVPLRNMVKKEEDSVWGQSHEDKAPEWDGCNDAEPTGNAYSEAEGDNLQSSFNDSFEASTPVQEEHPHSHTSPPHESSPVREEQSSFQSESSRSSPPRPEPPARTVVKLVIRNDGSGFTSKLLEKRRSSELGERRTLRSRSHSGHERGEGKKIKREPVTEEVEYIDVDNSKYSKGVSVKLERLSERTSQEYGLNIGSRASTSGSSGGVRGGQKTFAGTSGSTVTHASSSGSKTAGSKSGRRKRGAETVIPAVERRHAKRDCHFSGFNDSSCDGQRDFVFRDVKDERGFYVGSATESLDHFDSEDDEDRGHYSGESGNRVGQPVIDLTGEISVCSGNSVPPLPSTSTFRSSAVRRLASVGEKSGERIEHGHAGLEELLPAIPIDHLETQSHVFSQPHSSSFLHSHRLLESASSCAMETPFDLDSGDPQRIMINSQVQSAIDSVLNGSSSGDGGDLHTSHSYTAIAGSGRGPPQRDGANSSRNSAHSADRRHVGSALSTNRWGEERSEHDLDTAVHSIAR